MKDQRFKRFIKQYGKHIKSYKLYDNGIIRITFSNPNKIMWLKQRVYKELDMDVKTANTGKTYWFEPVK
jgi:hypothetical protein